MIKHIDEWGGPTPSRTSPPAGPSPATRRSSGPSRWHPNFGGTRNGMVITGPGGSRRKGEIRIQFHHVIDVAPTVLEAAGLPEPKMRQRHGADAHRGRQHGLHLRRREGEGPAQDAVLRDVRQPRDLPRRLGGRRPSTGALGAEAARHPSHQDSWELYDTSTRTSARRTIWRRRIPQKLKELQDLFTQGGGRSTTSADRRPSASSASTRRSRAGPISWGRGPRSPSMRACRA